jgi:hypothetical protein
VQLWPLYLKEEVMPRSWKLTLPLLIALMLLVGVPSASMASSDTSTSQIVRGEVEWTLPAGQCPSLQPEITVSGTGQRLQVITTTKKSNGQTEIIDNDFVTGTAKDNKGHSYSFVYTNQNRQLVPKSGSPIKVNMTDTFALSGNHKANNLNVDFIWSWTYSPPEPNFPPAHHWRKIFTLGDPLHCDPI